MDKTKQDFIGQVKQWLFSVEAALSVSSIKDYNSSIKPTMEKIDSFYSEAYNFYGLDLDEIMEEFTRVKHIYNEYLNSPK